MLKKLLFSVSIFFTVVIGHKLTSAWFDLPRMSIYCLVTSAFIISILSLIFIFKKQTVKDCGMSTSSPIPTPCDVEVFEHGEVVFQTHTIPSNHMEEWVQKIANKSGQRVDWSFMGGRAVVRAIGDMDAVKKALIELKPEHDQLYLKILQDQFPEIYAVEEFQNSPGQIMI